MDRPGAWERSRGTADLVVSATRNLFALTRRCWTGKLVGFLCAVGGQGSYLPVMDPAGSVMLDLRCFVVPRFVHLTGSDFTGDAVTSEALVGRLEQLAAEFERVSSTLASAD